MFKCGQLVKSKVTGLCYVVEQEEHFLPGKLIFSQVGHNFGPMVASPRSVTLIGNNYQPKTNTPAR